MVDFHRVFVRRRRHGFRLVTVTRRVAFGDWRCGVGGGGRGGRGAGETAYCCCSFGLSQ